MAPGGGQGGQNTQSFGIQCIQNLYQLFKIYCFRHTQFHLGVGAPWETPNLLWMENAASHPPPHASHWSHQWLPSHNHTLSCYIQLYILLHPVKGWEEFLTSNSLKTRLCRCPLVWYIFIYFLFFCKPTKSYKIPTYLQTETQVTALKQ